jgi:hypothetical protein
MTTRKGRAKVETTWGNNDRVEHWTKSRDYLLWSLFATILTAITDPKDDYAIRIKANPAYYEKTKYWTRVPSTTNWKTRILANNQ